MNYNPIFNKNLNLKCNDIRNSTQTLRLHNHNLIFKLVFVFLDNSYSLTSIFIHCVTEILTYCKIIDVLTAHYILYPYTKYDLP